MIYIDTSALVKLVVADPESRQLVDWLNRRQDQPLVTSIVGQVELLRAARRVGATEEAAAERLAATVDTLSLSESIARQAANLSPAMLRTLDAIHLATAYEYRESLSSLCVYDVRLAAAARSHGLRADSPGAQ